MRKILVIDDDPDVLKTVRACLERNGFEVVVAANGIEGLRKTEEVGPDLVLLDIIMPEQDGLETIQILRKTHPRCKIIAMTGGGSLSLNDLLAIAKKFGAQGRVEKPLTCEQLILEIERVLNQADPR